jgi:Surface lipoprotein
LGGCATQETVDGGVSDPLEPVNRAVFSFNEAADKAVIKPIAQGYVYVVPDPLRDSVQAFIRNLLSPITIANNLLQGDFNGAFQATGRLMTNTILGAGGIADVATTAGNPYEPEDFGQTLAVWGVGDGPYLVLPLLGPSNIRDAVGYGVDSVGDPIRIWGTATGHEELLYARTGASGIDRRSRLLDEVDDLRRNSLDLYATVRSLYAQQRASQIRDQNGKADTPDFPEYTSDATKK